MNKAISLARCLIEKKKKKEAGSELHQYPISAAFACHQNLHTQNEIHGKEWRQQTWFHASK